MRTRTLLSQVLAVNTVLVAVTAIVAAVLAPSNAGSVVALQRVLLIGLAVVSAVLVNTLLLKRRLRAARAPAADDGARRPRLPRPARQGPTTPRRARSSA